MPRRPESHVISDTAVNQILGICYACGWACERVQDDYGEDIIVQTTFNGEVDPYRIFIQSKGTSNIQQYKRKTGGYSYSFRAGTLRKWIRSKELIIVILWDVNQSYGLWTLPLDNVDEWQLFSTQHFALSFSEENIFNKEQADKLAWEARLRHYNHLLLESVDMDEQAEEFDDLEDDMDVYQSRTKLIAFDFLRRLGAVTVTENGRIIIDGQFTECFQNACRNLASENEVTDEESSMSLMHKAGMITFVWYLEQLTGEGAPRELIICCGVEAANLLYALVQTLQKE